MRFAFLMGLLVLISQTAVAADPSEAWTRFRGPDGSGVFTGSHVPLPWKANDVQWKVHLPGEGNGSPVIWQDKYYLMSADARTATRYLIAGDLKTGKTIWQKDFPSTTHGLHALSSYASSTPCLDADRVYFTWGAPESVTVKAFTHAGKEVWSRDLGKYASQHGFGTSPMLVDGLLVLSISQEVEGSPPGTDSLVAMSAETGHTVWQTPRTANVAASYGVPCIMLANGRKTLLTANTSDGFAAYDAQSGKTLWTNKSLKTKNVFDKRVVSSAVLAGNLVISTQGSGNGGNVLVAMKTDGYGQEAFRIDRQAPYVPTPVVVGDLVFLWDDHGFVNCIRLPDGKPVWGPVRTGGASGEISGSPIVINDKLLGVSQAGVVTIVSATDKYQKLGTIDLDATCRSTPAVDTEHLLIRTASELICIGTGK